MIFRIISILLIPLLILPPRQAVAAEQQAAHIDIGGMDVAVWTPAGTSPDRTYPLIVFSHGFTGCNGRSLFLTRALAAHGYLVMAPMHADNRCGLWRQDGRTDIPPEPRAERPFNRAAGWTDRVYRGRRRDIETVMDRALAGPVLGVRTDPRRIGIAGHSLGGYAGMALAGAWPSWRDPRVGAVLALSPYAEPFLNPGGGLETLAVPVMLQGGTLDSDVTPVNIRPGSVYDRIGGPKYYVEFAGTAHIGWTDRVDQNHDAIARYSIAFFDCALKHTGCAALAQRAPGVSALKARP